MDALERILALMREERPNLQLVCKADSPLMRATAVLVYPLTPDFADGFVTVLGDVIYLPRPQEEMSRTGLAAILAHEFVHQLDMATYGPLFYASYALVLPTGRTCRAWWERRAYAVDLMLAHEEGGPVGVERALEWIVPLFSGPSYGFMWAGRAAARRYLDEVARPVLEGTLQRQQPYQRILSAWAGRST